MDVVFATQTGSLVLEGAQVNVQVGSHWPAEDPIVRQYPGMFSTDPRYGLRFTDQPASLDDPPVEQATAAPGEVRGRVKRG